jgi:hypothetical protein
MSATIAECRTTKTELRSQADPSATEMVESVDSGSGGRRWSRGCSHTCLVLGLGALVPGLNGPWPDQWDTTTRPSERARGTIDYCLTSRRYQLNGGLPADVVEVLRWL